jgi:hypothetical protein
MQQSPPKVYPSANYKRLPANLQRSCDHTTNCRGNHSEDGIDCATQDLPALPTLIIDVGPLAGPIEPLVESNF